MLNNIMIDTVTRNPIQIQRKKSVINVHDAKMIVLLNVHAFQLLMQYLVSYLRGQNRSIISVITLYILLKVAFKPNGLKVLVIIFDFKYFKKSLKLL